jgi:uncharacterized membrane protein HdeD (DUF308 family)
MLDVLIRYWWVVALRGVLAVLFGLVALVWPNITIIVLVALFGAYVLVDGVIALGTAIFGGAQAARRRGWLIFEAVTGIAAGVITFIWPDITALALLMVIAAWALITGVVEILAAIRLRRELEGEWLLAVSGVASIVFGLLLAIRPSAGAVAVVWLIGAYAILFGAVLVALGLRLRKLHHGGAYSSSHRPAHA